MTKKLKRRLTISHLPQDRSTRTYLCLEMLLKCCLVTSTTIGIMICVACAYARYDMSYLVESSLHDKAIVDGLEATAPNATSPPLIPVVKKPHHAFADLGLWTVIMTSLLFTIGLLILTTSLFGLLAIMEKHVVFVSVFIVFILVNIFAEMYLLLLMAPRSDKFQGGLRDDLITVIRRKYDPGHEPCTASKIFNSAMIMGKCCGMKGPDDFKPMSLTLFNGTRLVVKVPPACCYNSSEKNVKGLYGKLVACAVLGPVNRNKMIHTRGCHEIAAKAYVRKFQHWAVLLTAILYVTQVLQMLVAMVMLRAARFASLYNPLSASNQTSAMDVTCQAASTSNTANFPPPISTPNPPKPKKIINRFSVSRGGALVRPWYFPKLSTQL